MSDELFEKGVAVREDMFGAEHGRKKIEAASDYTRDFEDLVTRFCFGDIWGREGLSRAERSMVTLSMLVALGRTWEVKVHTQGAIANGVTKDQIKEIMMNAAIYCGIPAANDGFLNSKEVLDKLEAE
jgi:4-carboxymuconolactone decarboxylase